MTAVQDLKGRDSAPAGGTGAPKRDRYIDSLRVVALVRVMAYHFFGWIWLPALFPSMGVMFALAGSLMAVSLDRSSRHYAYVLRKRLTRLLPPFWLMGAVIVPAMWLLGWTVTETAGESFDWHSALLWILPLSTPPSSAASEEFVVPLWYISTYLLLVVLSPPLLWLFRRWPLRTLAVPVVTVLLFANNVLTDVDRFTNAVVLVCTYAPCWMLGFAHRDGRIRRLPLLRVLPVSVMIAALGLAWAVVFPDVESGANVSDVPVATTLYSFGFALLLLRLYPDFSWLERVRWLDALVSAVNRRAMTIYLWGNTAIFMTWYAFETIDYLSDIDTDTAGGSALVFAAVWVVLGVFVLTFGWMEDVAARRPLSLLGLARRPGSSPSVPSADPTTPVLPNRSHERRRGHRRRFPAPSAIDTAGS